MSTFAPPSGAPPSSASANRRNSNDATDLDIPDEPPPAYSSVAGPQGDTTISAGPSRMDFSGPPPLPDRLTANITGVGIGYGARIPGVSPQPTGQSQSDLSSQYTGNNPFGDGNRPAPPPNHPSNSHASGFGNGNGSGGGGGFAAPSGPPPGKTGASEQGFSAPPPTSSSGFGGGSASAGPSRPPPPVDLSPTEVPTPGRPLLRKGQMLVYPKGYYCNKCGNTGYKANDPSNPHDTDWKKYGKQYTAALAASYTTSTGANANPSLTSASNFQRPLPNYQTASHQPQPHHGHPPGQWNTYPGHGARPPPPGQHYSHGPPPPPGPIYTGYAPSMWGPTPSMGMPPPGALILQPGDPRIGGRPCYNCGGSGREIGFFGFDDGKCYTCRGIGRVF